ncbi:HAD family phosphatase [Enterococcus faecium]|nr:HAD family phosphatase [Enterococcus faecium]
MVNGLKVKIGPQFYLYEEGGISKLFIFDMDGLLLETGRLAYRAYVKSAQKYDYEMRKEVYYLLTGQTEMAVREQMGILYGEDVPYIKWREAINQYKEKIVKEDKRVYTKKGAEEILSFAKERGIHTIVASSNTREKIEMYLRMENLYDFFEQIISGDDVEKGKPEPEIFLKACSKMNIHPSEALVFEDSIAGIEAARRAGILSFLIKDHLIGLPDHNGKHKLKVDVSLYESNKADYEFYDLHQAKRFLESKGLYL